MRITLAQDIPGVAGEIFKIFHCENYIFWLFSGIFLIFLRHFRYSEEFHMQLHDIPGSAGILYISRSCIIFCRYFLCIYFSLFFDAGENNIFSALRTSSNHTNLIQNSTIASRPQGAKSKIRLSHITECWACMFHLFDASRNKWGLSGRRRS